MSTPDRLRLWILPERGGCECVHQRHIQRCAKPRGCIYRRTSSTEEARHLACTGQAGANPWLSGISGSQPCAAAAEAERGRALLKRISCVYYSMHESAIPRWAGQQDAGGLALKAK